MLFRSQINGTLSIAGNLNTNNQWISGDGGTEGLQLADNGNATLSGALTARKGIYFPNAYAPDNNYVEIGRASCRERV